MRGRQHFGKRGRLGDLPVRLSSLPLWPRQLTVPPLDPRSLAQEAPALHRTCFSAASPPRPALLSDRRSLPPTAQSVASYPLALDRPSVAPRSLLWLTCGCLGPGGRQPTVQACKRSL